MRQFEDYSDVAQKIMLYLDAKGMIKADLSDKLAFHDINHWLLEADISLGDGGRRLLRYDECLLEMEVLRLHGIVHVFDFSDRETHYQVKHRTLHRILLTKANYLPRLPQLILGWCLLGVIAASYIWPRFAGDLGLVYAGIFLAVEYYWPGYYRKLWHSRRH